MSASRYTSTYSVYLLRSITLLGIGCRVVERIDRVVWKGKVINYDNVPTGKLIYRNDEIFFKQRRFIINLSLISAVTSFILLLLCLFGMIFFGLGFYFILFILSFFINTMVYFVTYTNWKTVDHGIGVHENGLDAIEIRSLNIPRVFIPYEEIGLLKVNWLRFTIQLKSSKKKFVCSSKMVDDFTLQIIEELRQGKRPSPEPPKLVVYGDGGASVTTRF